MNGILLTHGAGGNKDAALLVAVDAELTKLGWIVERVNLAFRIAGGSPRPATSGKDREGLAAGLEALRPRVDRLFLGGHSYGGRQGSMLLAEKGPGFVEGLLLMGYPLHPPGKPEQLRTAHFPELRTPAMFVSGSKDEFGTVEEMTEALKLIPGRKELVTVDGARHDLKSGKSGVALRIATEFARFVEGK
jgi:predicted alpha/beta-hydrolase family hydrolase